MANEGFGITIAFQSGYFAEIIGVNHQGLKRNSYDKTCNADRSASNGWRKFFFSALKDPGQLKVKVRNRAGVKPPIDQAAETITITFPVEPGESTADTRACSGALIEFDETADMEGLIEGDATIQWSGEPTWSRGS